MTITPLLPDLLNRLLLLLAGLAIDAVFGDMPGLLARIPIGTVIDHGPNRETTASPNPTAAQVDMNNPPPGS